MPEKKGDIHLSPKHGVNPAIPKCFYCMKDKNEVILTGRLPNDAEAPRNAVWNMEPCDECAEWMKKGIICISVRDGESGLNPYRTGGWAVLTDDAISRLFKNAQSLPAILKCRFTFIEDKVWVLLDLPLPEAK